MSSKEITPVYHKLFMEPANADPEWEPVNAAEVVEIRVFRREGKELVTLGGYAPDMLPDSDAVAALFGGGMFDVRAINVGGRVFRRCTFVLPGEPRMPASTNGAGPAHAPPPGIPEGDPLWLRAVGIFGPMLPAVFAYMREERSRADQQFQAMMTMMLESGKATSQQSAELVKVLLERATAPAPVIAPGPVSTIDQLRELRKFDKEIAKDASMGKLLEAGAAMALPLLLAKFGGGGFGGPPTPASC